MALKIGAKGNEVKVLQRLLQAVGYSLKVDGIFGPVTRAAVMDFQIHNVDNRGYPLICDGVVGPLTMWRLQNPNKKTPHVDPFDLSKIPKGGSKQGKAALMVALAEMQAGAREIGGNNKGRWVKKYLNGIVPEGNPWCAGFVSWCFSQIPQGIPFQYNVGARNILNQFKKKKWAFSAKDDVQPAPGDIIVWYRGSMQSGLGHIGIVHSYQNGVVNTIEGNRGPFPAPVCGFEYVVSREENLLGFGRVPD
ncbi:MAG TPA: CHAP domain-containing protein [bacterium]|nr:CHAP domain-containing protein [bacterium]